MLLPLEAWEGGVRWEGGDVRSRPSVRSVSGSLEGRFPSLTL